MSEKRSVTIVSFSGIDGSGKSTQINSLLECLTDAGIGVRLLSFWDDIAVLGGVREFSSHKLFRSEPGIGSPGKPVNRRDKNVRRWYLTPIRFFLYFLDSLKLRAVAMRHGKEDAEVIIFDRYLYDELANLDLTDRFTQYYIHFLLRIVPEPDIANLIDADPVQARQRKPEYPLEFIYANRAAYLAFSKLTGSMNVVSPGSISQVHRAVMQGVVNKLTTRQAEAVQRKMSLSNYPSAEQVAAAHRNCNPDVRGPSVSYQ